MLTSVIALTALSATIGLVVVFFVVFPALVQGLIALIIVQILGERDDNQQYARGRRKS
jgi:hypothetical protein